MTPRQEKVLAAIPDIISRSGLERALGVGVVRGRTGLSRTINSLYDSGRIGAFSFGAVSYYIPLTAAFYEGLEVYLDRLENGEDGDGRSAAVWAVLEISPRSDHEVPWSAFRIRACWVMVERMTHLRHETSIRQHAVHYSLRSLGNRLLELRKERVYTRHNDTQEGEADA